jgi:hypothetical protein
VDCDQFTDGDVPVSDLISKPAIPTIGQAELVATVGVVTIKCPCTKNTIIMGQMGVPLVCANCKRVWFVSSKSQITIQEVIGAKVQESTSNLVTQ